MIAPPSVCTVMLAPPVCLSCVDHQNLKNGCLEQILEPGSQFRKQKWVTFRRTQYYVRMKYYSLLSIVYYSDVTCKSHAGEILQYIAMNDIWFGFDIAFNGKILISVTATNCWMAEYGRLEQWSISFSPLPATVDQISSTALDKTFQSTWMFLTWMFLTSTFLP